MPIQEETYRGTRIQIVEDDTSFELRLDGDSVAGVERTQAGRYASAYYPYEDFDSALSLAKRLVDRRKGPGPGRRQS